MIGFFGKKMVLSAALDKGYIFLSLVAIITSVIGVAYYLNIIKEMFFFKSDYKGGAASRRPGPRIEKINIRGRRIAAPPLNDNYINFYSSTNISISSYISLTISTITLIILLFIVDSQT